MSMGAYKKTEYDENKPRLMDTVFDLAELVVLTLFAVLLITSLLFRHAVVEGSSMEKTLFNREHLLVSSACYEPKNGDIIVFYSDKLQKPLVKRVIATEGQRVKITSHYDVFVDGEKIDSSYVYTDSPAYDYEYANEYTVSDGCVFVLGDHRDDSVDSRILGEIEEQYIYGKVIFRISPIEKFGKIS